MFACVTITMLNFLEFFSMESLIIWLHSSVKKFILSQTRTVADNQTKAQTLFFQLVTCTETYFSRKFHISKEIGDLYFQKCPNNKQPSLSHFLQKPYTNDTTKCQNNKL